MIIKAKVKLNSSKNLILKKDDSNWIVYTTKSAVNNEANDSIIKLISKDMKVAKSRVSIIKGMKNKEKTLEIV